MSTETCPEDLQQEIEETRSRLSARLETLESQYNVVENVQQAGNAVAAAVEAVQATAQVVNTAADTLHSATDVEGHIRRHPWLCLGGTAVAAFLLTTWLNQPRSSTGEASAEEAPDPVEPLPAATPQMPAGFVTPIESPAVVASRAYHQAMLQSSPGYNLKILAMNMLMGVAREAAARAVPRVTDLLLSQMNGHPQHANTQQAGTAELSRAD